MQGGAHGEASTGPSRAQVPGLVSVIVLECSLPLTVLPRSLTAPRDSAPGPGLSSSDPCALGSDSGEPGGQGAVGGSFEAECVLRGVTELSGEAFLLTDRLCGRKVGNI